MVTKAEVGLGNVENYGVASNTDALNQGIIDKYITPATLNYAMNAIFNQTSNTKPGIVKLNIGTANTDDDDLEKAITSKGLNTLLTNSGSISKLHESLIRFNKDKMVNTISSTGTNNINIVTSPNITTDKVHGFISFTASANNTGNVQVSTNGSTYYTVYTLDNQPLVAGMLVQNKTYTLYALKNSFVIINPTQLEAVGNTATQSKNGLMSIADKTKLDAISGTNTGDESTNTILTKLNGIVVDCGLLT